MNQSNWTQEKYIQAYFYAAEALKEKSFPGTDLPYLVHISLVSMEVMAALQVQSGLDGDLALQCALLHDVIEDTKITRNQLEADFDKRVANGVAALSKDKAKSETMQDSLERIKQQPLEIWIVKMADRICNLLPPPKNWTTRRKERYLEESNLIYEKLHSKSAFLAKRLLDKIEAYKKYI